MGSKNRRSRRPGPRNAVVPLGEQEEEGKGFLSPHEARDNHARIQMEAWQFVCAGSYASSGELLESTPNFFLVWLKFHD